MVVPPIVIDTQQLIEQFNIPPKQINTMLDNIAKGLAASYAMALEKEAQRQLKQTKTRYINNIKVVDGGKLTGTVLVDYSKDKLIQMLEEGASPFDIKVGLLNGPKVKVTAKGRRYTTVPFRHGAPDSDSGNPLFNGGILPRLVQRASMAMPQNVPMSGGGLRSAGLNLSDIPAAFQTPRTRGAIVDQSGNVLWRAYQNRSALHEGLVRMQDVATGQNKYMTFRRVSESGIGANGGKIGSDPDAFIHPGIKQYNLVQAALSKFNIPTETGLQLDAELTKLGLIP